MAEGTCMPGTEARVSHSDVAAALSRSTAEEGCGCVHNACVILVEEAGVLGAAETYPAARVIYEHIPGRASLRRAHVACSSGQCGNRNPFFDMGAPAIYFNHARRPIPAGKRLLFL